MTMTYRIRAINGVPVEGPRRYRATIAVVVPEGRRLRIVEHVREKTEGQDGSTFSGDRPTDVTFPYTRRGFKEAMDEVAIRNRHARFVEIGKEVV